MTIHSEQSSYREKLLEHLFIGEVLRDLWSRGVTDAEFLRPEVDCGGFDLVITLNRIMRHIQLKTSHTESATARQSINIRLADKSGGCVVWMRFHPETLSLGPFLWYGGSPGEPLPDIRELTVAKHTKGNARGLKTERPNIRVLPRRKFEEVATISELVLKLFGKIEKSDEQTTRRRPVADDMETKR